VKLVADWLVTPLDRRFAPDGSGRRFIVDQTGVPVRNSTDESLT
jgi:hypothetical protein